VLSRLYTTPPRLLLLPTGAGQPKPLDTGSLLVHRATFSPDGKQVLLVASEGREHFYYSLPLSGGSPRRIAPTGVITRDFSRDLITPDGKLLARIGRDNHAVLLSLESGEERPASGIEQNERLVRWSSDGRTLFVYRRNESKIAFTRVDPYSGKREPWKEIVISEDPVGLRGEGAPIQMSADGRAIFWGYQRYSDELYLVEGLK
jgi:dipeptidyl aminopeptidase/acylaminoacyl peptidase